MKFKKLLAAAGVAAVASAGAVGPAGADTDGTPDIVILSGSDTTYEMMVELSDLYNRAFGCPTAVTATGATQPRNNGCVNFDGTPFTNYTPEMLAGNADHDVMVNQFPTGSSNGLAQLSGNNQAPGTAPPAGFIQVDVARSSRQRGTADNGGLRFVAFAREALTWAAFNGQGLPTNLTQAQLVNIYTGCNVDAGGNPDPNTPNWINNWNEIPGGPNRPITVYAAQNVSGTRATFDSFLGVSGTPSNTTGSAKCIPAASKDGGPDDHIVFENNANPIVAQGQQPNAIFYFSGGRYREVRERRLFLGAINGIAPTIANVQTATFPFSRFVYNAFRNNFTANNADEAATTFAGVPNNGAPGFICRSDAQSGIDPIFNRRYSLEVRRIIRSHGFAPLLEDASDPNGAVPGRSACRVEVRN